MEVVCKGTVPAWHSPPCTDSSYTSQALFNFKDPRLWELCPCCSVMELVCWGNEARPRHQGGENLSRWIFCPSLILTSVLLRNVEVELLLSRVNNPLDMDWEEGGYLVEGSQSCRGEAGSCHWRQAGASRSLHK